MYTTDTTYGATIPTMLATSATPPATTPPANCTLPMWGGHSTTSLIRAMAVLGGTPSPITKVLGKLGIVCSPHTVTTQCHAARSGHGKPAPLTPAQRTELVNLLNAARGVTPLV